MNPDDPRHGKNAGYLAGCSEACCRTAHADYRRALRSNWYLMGVERLYVDVTGTVRRIRALQAMGWRYVDLDRALGRAPSHGGATWSHNLMHQQRIHVANAQLVAALYERLSMTPGPSDVARRRALRKGYHPPLAWNDIDDPNERPRRGTDHRRKDDVDHAVIQRVLDGEVLDTTQAEKRIILSRWIAAGRSEKSLCERMGWRHGRYLEAS